MYNRQALVITLSSCACCDGSHDSMEMDSSLMTGGRKISAEVAKYMAVLLIEQVTPDIMYNGIPWPEEEFMKVTVERSEIIIKNLFSLLLSSIVKKNWAQIKSFIF